MTRLLLGLAIALTVVGFDPEPAAADGWRRHHGFARHHSGHHRWGHHRSRLWFGTSFHYIAPPVYAYRPRVIYVPVPRARVAPPPRPYCREYQGDAIIDGTNRRFYGTACLQADGAWHIVN